MSSINKGPNMSDHAGSKASVKITATIIWRIS